MIEYLKIKNLALVDDAEIEFSNGFNVISGETGAGKSVIINAIALLFGKRADKSIIRSGEKRCELSMAICLKGKTKDKIKKILENYGISYNDKIIIRKVITPASSRNFINDSAVTLNILNNLKEDLVNFYTPDQHQNLLKTEYQLEILDQFGGLLKLRDRCEKVYNIIKEKRNKLEEIIRDVPDSIEIENLQRIAREIESCEDELKNGKELTKEFEILSNSKEINEIAYRLCNILEDSEGSILEQLGEINRLLDRLLMLDQDRPSSFLSSAKIVVEEIKELTLDIRKYAEEVDINEQNLYEIEEKISKIQNLKRKYGYSLDNIFYTLSRAKDKLNKAEKFEDIKYSLEDEIATFSKEYNRYANLLSEKRREIATQFASSLKEKLKNLGFIASNLEIKSERTSPTKHGLDHIEIMFSPNIGERVLPIKDIASSGEISRLMLAIKSLISEKDSIPILIFDEIDANIGGETANKIGIELKNLGKNHQVLCISHLPQIASLAVSHFRVEKDVIDGKTYSKIEKLKKEKRIEELTRMLGGSKMASHHAKELLKKTYI